MPDNVTLPGAGVDVATDDVGGIAYQRVKVTHGPDGQADDVSPAAPLPTISQAGTATVTSVAAATSSTELAAASLTRRGLSVFNDSIADLRVKFGTGASTSSYTVKVGPGQLYEMPSPIYTGAVHGIWSAADGNARITELTT